MFSIYISLTSKILSPSSARVKEKHPWFWVFKGFISSRPNLIHTGIGNNSTGYDVSILQRGGLSDHETTEPPEVEDFEGTSSDLISTEDWYTTQDVGDNEGVKGEEEGVKHGGSGDEGEVDSDNGGSKVGDKRRKALGGFDKSEKKIKVDDKKPTVPRAGKSTPSAVASSTQKKSRTGIEKFSEIALKEEETTQKILELKKTKAKGVADKEIAKVKSKADVEMNRDKLKADLAEKKLAHDLEEKKLEFEYKLRMAELQARTHAPTQAQQGSHHHVPAHSAVPFAFPGPSSVQSHSHLLYENSPAQQSLTEELHSEHLSYNSTDYNLQGGDNDDMYLKD